MSFARGDVIVRIFLRGPELRGVCATRVAGQEASVIGSWDPRVLRNGQFMDPSRGRVLGRMRESLYASQQNQFLKGRCSIIWVSMHTNKRRRRTPGSGWLGCPNGLDVVLRNAWRPVSGEFHCVECWVREPPSLTQALAWHRPAESWRPSSRYDFVAHLRDPPRPRLAETMNDTLNPGRAQAPCQQLRIEKG